WWQRIERSTFRRLAVSIRSELVRESTSGDLSISGNVFEVDEAQAPIVLGGPRVDVRRNYVACPAQACETTSGTHPVAPWSQVVPTLYVGSDREATVIDADADVRAYVVLESVRADGSRETTALPSEAPFAELVHSWAETPNPVGAGDGRGLSSSQLVHTTGAGTGVVVSVRVQGRPATRTYRALGAAPRAIGLPRILGRVRHGSTVTCESPAWPVPPTSIAYRWAGGGRTSTEQARSIDDADVRFGALTCTVIANFAIHRGAVSKRTVTVERVPLRLQRYALNAGWRIMSCGSTTASACRTRRNVGVRFWLASRSKKSVKATISMQRQVRGRWIPWVRGTIPMPMKGGSYIPGKLAASGTYRICFTVPAHDIYSGGTTRWQYWRVG
ncbi:MAG: hypothetical protein JWM86_1554, partial [Thermoleophilia bacterium]|nr:hypothetical protein [Thermoleophilia bacterium]